MGAPCGRTCGGGSSGSSSGSSGSSGTITITQKSGSNQWWYAVTVSASNGLSVTSLKMKANGGWSWESGVQEWDYWKFTANSPYSAPFSFQATLSTGQVVEGQVINSMYDGASGTLSVSSAYTASDASTAENGGMASGEVAAVVICSVLALCVMGALCFVCYRKRTKVIAAGVDDEEDVGVIGDKAMVDGTAAKTEYDMTPIDGQAGNTGDNEEEVMIEVPVTETRE